MATSKILIYRDYGVSDLTNLTKGLRCYFEPKGIEVSFTDASAIIKDDILNKNISLFIMPGGAATPFLQKLQVQGNDKIRDYIFQGGNYLGICAGAYYACRNVSFETDIEPLAIKRENELLSIVQACAVGTLKKELNLRPYMKNEESGAVVKLQWQNQDIYYAHYHGGPKFVSEHENYDILARYADIEGNPAAIIRQNYGKGRIVLSGVHFEDRGDDLIKTLHALRIDFDKAQNIALKLKQNEQSRKILFDKIMSSFEK